jgi:hypothetical protein
MPKQHVLVVIFDDFLYGCSLVNHDRSGGREVRISVTGSLFPHGIIHRILTGAPQRNPKFVKQP